MSLLITRRARQRLGWSRGRFADSGKIPVGTAAEARDLADTLRKAAPGTLADRLTAGELRALSALQEILWRLLERFVRERHPDLWREALSELERGLGVALVNRTLRRFARELSLQPAVPLDAGDLSPPAGEYLTGREKLLQELLVFWLLDSNPAAAPLVSILHQESGAGEAETSRLIEALTAFLERQPALYTADANLLQMLQSPARESPDSLEGQLRIIRDRWGDLVQDRVTSLLEALDLLAEEATLRDGGPGPSEVPRFSALADAEVHYSPDRSWMARLVLVAKNVLVWLDQLSTQYGRPLRGLDQIPDEALSELSRRGINGLWLIGVWERSPASRRLKRLCGNPEAEASAYSLVRYSMARELGGEQALEHLRAQAWRFGIRLAVDMVPNHMGLDSDWLQEHPEWFLSVGESPFPSYTFRGPDLSADPRAGIFLEDRYYDRTDAAVVFKHVDRRSGQERYIYHGNDGTSTPWNDTAQLDYLKPEVREAVVQTILDVARRFPIIRFDAAMTLAKKHYQRLWFPGPGDGGAIPSRTGHGISPERFDELMPREFWREVVDRVAAESPDTLLLAEAFWLMEGYFVRTLGMHRVYNSAFMNMLRDQENAKYRRLIKETLAFDPEILKRYVNFMSNPDERTAIDQFGKGDLYFGVCVLLATMPGLPMFGHGQVEGYAERYGMEYRRAYLRETPDAELVGRHERQIAPLLRQREIFAEVQGFRLYDFVTADGGVDENVIAFSNGDGAERFLVIFNNRYAATHGRLRRSAEFMADGHRRTQLLGDALGLPGAADAFCLLSDRIGGLTYIRSCAGLHETGFELELGAFQSMVLTDIRAVRDAPGGPYRRLEERLAGGGCPDLEKALEDHSWEPARARLAAVLTDETLRTLERGAVSDPAREPDKALLDDLESRLAELLDEVARLSELPSGREAPVARITAGVRAILELPVLDARLPWPVSPRLRGGVDRLRKWLEGRPEIWGALLGAVLVEALEEAAPGLPARLEVSEALHRACRALEQEPEGAERSTILVGLVGRERWLQALAPPGRQELFLLLEHWLSDPQIGRLIGHHRAGKVDWIREQDLEDFLQWRFALAAAAWTGGREAADPESSAIALVGWWEALERLKALAARERYRVEQLLTLCRVRARGSTGGA